MACEVSLLSSRNVTCACQKIIAVNATTTHTINAKIVNEYFVCSFKKDSQAKTPAKTFTVLT